MTNKGEAVVAYVPVIHAGYVELFERHSSADMHVLDTDVLSNFPDLRKDIRALKPAQAVEIIDKMKIFPKVTLLGEAALLGVSRNYEDVVMPRDEVSEYLTGQYFTESAVYEEVFLRWDRRNVAVDQEISPDRVEVPDERLKSLLKKISSETEKSTNIWRGVGAGITTVNGQEIVASNRHVPTDYSPFIDGDPRSFLKRGMGIEVTTDQHAEAKLIALAARLGISLEGAEITVETFPCPLCAKQIAASGIKTCNFIAGYASLDGETVLRDAGVELIKLDYEMPNANLDRLRPYPEKKSI